MTTQSHPTHRPPGLFLSLLIFLLFPAFVSLSAKKEQSSLLKDIVECHNLGQQAYHFHDATVWNNDVYALQKQAGGCRLIRFKYDGDGLLQFAGYKTINSSRTHRKMSMVVWYGKLYIFWNDGESNWQIYYTYVDFNDKGDNGKDLDNLVVHGKYTVTDGTNNFNAYDNHCNGYLETVVFQGRLYLGIGVSGGDYKNQLELRSTVTVPDDTNKGKLVFKTGVTHVADGSTPVKLFGGNGNCVWDMQVWRGKVNGTPGERLIVSLLNDKKLKVYSWDGFKIDDKGKLTTTKYRWNAMATQSSVGSCYSLKIVQGALATTETYTEANLNSLLFVYASKDDQDIQMRRYLPETAKFAGGVYHTGTHDGYLGVTSNFLVDNEAISESSFPAYRMKIHVFSAWETEKNYCTTLLGNYAKVTTDRVPISLSMIDTLPSLRSLIRLQYVLEGMPPTPIVKEKDFKEAVDELGYVSSIVIGRQEDRAASLGWEVDFSAIATLGYQRDDDGNNSANLSLGGHGNFQDVQTRTVTKEVDKKLNLVNIDDLNKGWAFYSEPIMDLNWIALYSPNDPKMRVPYYPEELRMGLGDYTLREYSFDLSIINVDASDYDSWSDRLYSSSFGNCKSLFSVTPVIGHPADNQISYGEGISQFNSSTRGFIFGLDLSQVVPMSAGSPGGFHLGLNVNLDYDYTQTQTTTNADVFTVNYPAYRTGDPDFLSDVKPDAFTVSLYALHYQYDTSNKKLSDTKLAKDMDNDASDAELAFNYYKMLEKQYIHNASGDSMPMRIANEFPIILAWQAGSEMPNNLRSCVIGENTLEADADDASPRSTRWFSITPKSSGTIRATIKGLDANNRIILREGLDMIRKYAVSRYDEGTGETTVSLQITEGEPVYIGFSLLERLAERRNWTLSLERVTKNEQIEDESFNVRASGGNLYVSWPSAADAPLDITIYAMNGQELYHGRHLPDEAISLSGQRAQVCVATVSDGTVTRSRRFMLR